MGFIKCKLKIPSSAVQKTSHTGKRDMIQRKEYPLVHSGRISVRQMSWGSSKGEYGNRFCVLSGQSLSGESLRFL